MTPDPSYADRAQLAQRAHAQLKSMDISRWPVFADWFTDSGEQGFLSGAVSSREVTNALEKAWGMPDASTYMVELVRVLGPLLHPIEWSEVALKEAWMPTPVGRLPSPAFDFSLAIQSWGDTMRLCQIVAHLNSIGVWRCPVRPTTR